VAARCESRGQNGSVGREPLGCDQSGGGPQHRRCPCGYRAVVGRRDPLAGDPVVGRRRLAPSRSTAGREMVCRRSASTCRFFM